MAVISRLSTLDQSNNETLESAISQNFNQKLVLTETDYVDKFIATVEKDGIKIVRFEESDVAQEHQRWKKALTVYVLGAKPPYNDIETRTKVMEAVPWSFDSRPMIVKPWTVEANLKREDLVEVPVRVRYPNLKLHLWSPHLLSKIAIVIGKLLFIEKMTADRERITCARVCVEVKVNVTLPEVIIIEDPNGNMIKQRQLWVVKKQIKPILLEKVVGANEVKDHGVCSSSYIEVNAGSMKKVRNATMLQTE
ncbi:hypothetical protein LguiA_020373 [Lonicera macranthoides]